MFRQLILWWLTTAAVLSQATPGTYPYAKPLPVTGGTPALSIHASGVINSTAYQDSYPAVWDNFIGGGYRSVGTTTERDAINAGRRKEGMLVWVAADSHTYRLATDLTTWTDLGILAAGGSATTLYNGNSSLTGNRTVTGANNNMDFVGLGNFSALANTSITLGAPSVILNGGSFTRINNSGPSPFVFAAAPSVAGSTHQLLARDPSTGEVTFTPNATIGGASGIYRGVVTGTPGTWVAATATLTPAYSSGSQPPEATVAILKFPSNSIGTDTLKLGDNTSNIGIVRRDGTAIAADDITAGQYIVFTRSGTTSGSKWTCESCGAGTSPSPSADVVSVDDSSDLASAVASIVITRGYYTPGDGGHAAYRSDSSSAATINNITVFDRTAAGRYILMQSGSISAKQAGAVGDGLTDDHDAIQGLFDVTVGLAARLEPLTYYVNGGLTLNAGVRVIASEATLNFDTTGSEDRAIDVQSNTRWTGGAVNVHRVSGGDGGDDHLAFLIGHYIEPVGASNVVISGVTITTDWDSDLANAILITGTSHDVTVENCSFPSSATLRTWVACHWGFVTYPTASAGTVHPYDIKILNISGGTMTCPSGDGTPVTMSACYNVTVDGVKADRVRFGIEYVAGDFGYQYSGFQGQTIGSVVFRNYMIKRCYNMGILTVGVDSLGNTWPLEGVVENSTFLGSNDGGGLGGLYMQKTVGLVVRNCVIAGFERGTDFDGSNKNISIQDTLFTTNRLGGFVMNDATSSNVLVSACRFTKNGWGASSHSSAAIQLLAGANCRLINNQIGDVIATEANQEVGIKIIPTFKNAVATGNFVSSVKSGGSNIAYYLGGSSDTGHLWLFQGNTAASGITLISGPGNIPYLQRGLQRTFSATGVPTIGTYIVGDRFTIDGASSSPFELVNTVAGSPGSFSTTY